MSIKVWLSIRGVFNLFFGVALLSMMQMQPLHGFSRGGVYSLSDGLLGLALTVALWRNRRYRLLALVAGDAIVRILLGVLVLKNPDLHRLILGQAIFFTVVILACIGLGFSGLIVAGSKRNGGYWDACSSGIGLSLITISTSTLLLGIGFAVGAIESQQRLLLAAYSIAVGLAFCHAGYKYQGSIS